MPGNSPAVNTRAASRTTPGNSPRIKPSPAKLTVTPSAKPVKKQTGPSSSKSSSPALSQTSTLDRNMGTSQGSKSHRGRPSGMKRKSAVKVEAVSVKAEPTTPPAGSTQTTPKGSIRTRLATGSIHMNGTNTISTAKEKAELDHIIKQIHKSETSGPPRSAPGSGKKRSSTSLGPAIEEIPQDHPPPKKRKIGRNDGSGEDNRNDYFCWVCHKEGMLVCCELCPRVYHVRCLGLTGELPQDWVCPECEKIMQAECVDTRSKSMEMLGLDQLCMLLKYALDRMKHQGCEPFMKAVDASNVPSYSDYIFNPMDLATLEKNIKKKQYGCTEAFLADAKWIHHNCTIYNGGHNKLTTNAKMIVKICKHEVNEIELCPDCYLNSCIRENEEWFSEPCRVPHTLVWAKLKGYPFWPAKALREMDGQVDVRFFGAHDRSWVPVSQCFLLSKNIPTSLQKGKKNAGLSGAIQELQTHINKLRKRFGGFEYAPFRTPYDKTDSYKPINPKPTSPVQTPVFYNQKTERGQIKRSAAAKTASALKSKYNMMVSGKKLEGSPKKLRRDRIGVSTGIDSTTLAITSADDESVTADENVRAEENENKLVETAMDKDTELPNLNASASYEPGDNSDWTNSKQTKKSEAENSEEKVTGKQSFVSSSIVDRLAKKIQALNEDTTDSDSRNKDSTGVTKVNEATSMSESSERTDLNQTNVDGVNRSETQTCEEAESKMSETDNSKEKNESKIEENICPVEKNAKDMIESRPTSEKICLIEKNVEDKTESTPTSEKSKDDNTDLSTSATETSDKSDKTCENGETKESANTEKVEPEEKETSQKAAKINDESSPHTGNASENIQKDQVKDIVSKDSYKKKLESTILSCKAKLGVEREESLDSNSGDNEMGVDSLENSDSEDDDDDEEEDEDMDTGDGQEDGEESDSSDNVDMDLDEVDSDEDSNDEDPDSDGAYEEILVDNPMLQEIQTGDLKTSDSETVENQNVKSCAKDTSSENNEAKVTSPDKSETKETSQDKNDAQEKLVVKDDSRETSLEQATSDAVEETKEPVSKENPSKQNSSTSKSVEKTDDAVKEDLLPGKETGTVKSDTCEDASGSEQGASTVESDAVDERTDKSVGKSAKDDNFSVAINENTIKASIGLIQHKSSADKDTEKNQEKEQTVTTKKMLVLDETDGELIETDTVEDDSDIDRLVIDLDSENNASPARPSKFCVRGGNVKNVSDFKKGVSPLFSDKTPRTVEKDKLKVDTKARSGLKIPNESSKKAPAILAKNADKVPEVEKTTDKQAVADMEVEDESDLIVMDHVDSAMEVEDEPPASDGATNSSSGPSVEGSSAGNTKKGKEKTSKTGSASSKIPEKFSKQLMSTIQKTLEEMHAETLAERVPEHDNQHLQWSLDQALWDYKAQLTELKHNFKLTVSEMKGCWEAEKEQLRKSLEIKHKAEMEKTVADAKKKQWCAQCGKEAIFYCCWNTSYCDYPCQQSHWPQHMQTCLQTNKDAAKNPTPTTTSTVATTMQNVTSTGTVSSGMTSAISTPQASSSTSIPQENGAIRQRLQDSISKAIYREEEKMGVARNAGVSPKFIPMSAPMNVLPTVRQSPSASVGGSLLFPSNLASSSQMAPPTPGMMQQLPRNMFLNQQLHMPPQRMSVQTSRPVGSNMLIPQPVLQQQTIYPVHLQQQQQQQAQSLGGTILFQNPAQQQGLMGYGMRPPF